MNPLIITAFFVTTLISFGIMLIILRPTKDEKSMGRRLISLADKNSELMASGPMETLLKRNNDSSFGWMEGAFDSLSLSLSQKLRMLILQANSKKSPGTIMIYCVAAGIGGAFLYFVFAPFPIVAPAVGLATAFLPIAAALRSTLNIARAPVFRAFSTCQGAPGSIATPSEGQWCGRFRLLIL